MNNAYAKFRYGGGDMTIVSCIPNGDHAWSWIDHLAANINLASSFSLYFRFYYKNLSIFS